MVVRSLAMAPVAAAVGAVVMFAGHATADDVVHFGDGASEAEHEVAITDAPLGGGVLGETARRLNANGSIAFDLSIDPQAQNYVTLRYWGGATSVRGNLYLNDAAGNGFAWNHLDHPSSAGIAPDRWYYSTVPLPRSMTFGKSRVRLSLDSDLSSGQGRDLFAAFSHTNPRLSVNDGVAQNPAVAPYDWGHYTQPALPERTAEHDRLVGLANNFAHRVANLQVLNTNNLPDALLGAFEIRTGPTDQATLDATHDHHNRRDNLGPLRGANVLAYAYKTPGTDFYQDAGTLHRVAMGLDYTRRAQGSTGGYYNPWEGGWVGGPTRNWGSGSLEGITHDDIANAFLQIHAEMESAGLLDQLVDDDNSAATPKVTRRQAYTDLFKGFVDFHTGYFDNDGTVEPGHAPNQDIYQLRGLIESYRALELLDPSAVDEAEFAPIVVSRAYESFGLTKNSYNNSWWFSPEGLPLEAGGLLGGGYSSEYGHGVAAEMFPIIDAIGDLATDEQRATLTDRAVQAANVWQHFLYPVYHEDGSIDLRLEGAINWRNLKSNGLQGLHEAPWIAAALDHDDPASQRILELLWKDGRLSIDTIDNGHFWQQGVWTMEQVSEIDRILEELPETDFRLPHEAGQPDYAFVDAVGGAVSIKHDGRHIFAALNWHHGQSNGEPIANNIARLHEVTPTEDRIAMLAMENPHGFGELALLEYDDLLIAANASDANTYEVLVAEELAGVFDLVSQQYLPLDDEGRYTLDARESAVFVLTPLPGDATGDGRVSLADFLILREHFGQGQGQLFKTGDFNDDGEVSLADFLILRANFGSSDPAELAPLDAWRSTVPEPSTAGVWSAGGFALILKRRRRRAVCS